MIRFVIIFEIALGIRTLIYFSRKHLYSVYIDYDNNVLKINKFWAFKKPYETTLKLNELVVSEIKHYPFSTFAFFVSFTVKDNQNLIKLTSADYGVEEKNIKKIYKKINTTTAIILSDDDEKSQKQDLYLN